MDDTYNSGPFSEQQGSSAAFAIQEGRDPRLDNQPPIAERIVMEFDDTIANLKAADGKTIRQRLDTLIENAEKCPETIEDEATAGKAADFIKQARQLEKDVETARESHNRPLIDARAALKQRADGLVAPLLQVGGSIRTRLTTYVQREEKRKREELARETEAAAERERIAREALAKEGVEAPPIEEPIFTPAPVQRGPVARGAYGSSASARTVKKHEILVPIAKLPASILNNAKVIETINQVIAAQIRAGTTSIKGVRIYETTEMTVR